MPKNTKPTENETPFKEHAFLGEIKPGTGSTSICVRVTSSKDGPKMLDIRQYVEAPRYTGFTAKGVSIPLTKVADLVNLLIEPETAELILKESLCPKELQEPKENQKGVSAVRSAKKALKVVKRPS